MEGFVSQIKMLSINEYVARSLANSWIAIILTEDPMI